MNILNQFVADKYACYNGDSCEVVKEIPDNSIHYTLKEKGKNWTVKEAVNAAGHVLSADGRKGICTNSIKGRDRSEKISMEELA